MEAINPVITIRSGGWSPWNALERGYEAEAELKNGGERNGGWSQNLKIWFGMSKNRNI